MEKLKIVIITEGLYPFSIGGMQKHALQMANSLSKMGAEVILISGCKYLPTEAERLKYLSPTFTSFFIPFPILKRLPGHYLRANKKFSISAFCLLKEKNVQADVIYFEGFAGAAIELYKKEFPQALIGAHFHGLNMFDEFHRSLWQRIQRVWLVQAAKKIMKREDIHFSYFGKFKEIYQKLGFDQHHLFQPNGIEFKDNKVLSRLDSKLRLLFVGRNDPVKGLGNYLEVISLLEDGKAEYHFVGDLPPEIFPKRSDIILHGKLSDEELGQLYSSMDVLVCPSLSEGMPTVILEGMSHGLAILATDVGAVKEMTGNDNGILMECSDPILIEEAIRTLIGRTNEELDQMKKVSLERVKKFDWNQIARQTIADLKQALLKHRGA